MTNRTYTFISDPKVQEILELADSLRTCLEYPISFEERLIPDEQAGISAALIELVERRYSEHFEQKILEVIKRK